METKESRERLIRENMTARGGWSREFLASIGVPWPPAKGWQKRFIEGGHAISGQRAQAEDQS